MSIQLLPALTGYLGTVEKKFDLINWQRKSELNKIADAVTAALHTTGKAALIYVCTHNSRRSHMGQLWAAAAAAYYAIPAIATYSGGTEITAFNPNAIKALQEAGFKISGATGQPNPHYSVVYASGADPLITFSKKYMDKPNPTSNFIAVMTCSHADDNCPFVTGATLKVATPYEDPKDGDGKPSQDQVYSARCEQIATEVLYTFSLVQSTLRSTNAQ
ncbi:low molecular weight phosphatase family protein [Deminuibacter soli]|uniref:Protein-tyrosine-phosphatase n=1 Tax=Deminuibacter soli TaxID=2291815 RepID=A0A3E1NGL7_9BACT|nr:protein-tyrosine-phosphatase [Deminuibacter soli]RFM27022.1 protein-tyrosine-phosphatase [Deminuibacter soli]